MIEEIRSMTRCFKEDFGLSPEYLIIGQDQLNRLLSEIHKKNKSLFSIRENLNKFLGTIGEFNGLTVIVVTSDILEVV